MTRTILLALAGLSLLTIAQPASAQEDRRNDASKPVIVRMSEILTTRLGVRPGEDVPDVSTAPAGEPTAKHARK